MSTQPQRPARPPGTGSRLSHKTVCAYRDGEDYCNCGLDPRIPAPSEPAPDRFDAHVKHVEKFLQEMYAIMIDCVEDSTGNVEDTCRLLLNAARRDRETINHLMNPAPPAAQRPRATQEYVKRMIRSWIKSKDNIATTVIKSLRELGIGVEE